jgi:hypothetical protein
MRFEGLATYYDMPDLKKYVAERAWWPHLSRQAHNAHGAHTCWPTPAGQHPDVRSAGG